MENAGSVLMTPMQLGPIIRIPYRRATASSSCSRASPSPPTSRKPDVMTMSPRAPAAPHSSATSHACSLGTAITATSTGSGMAPTLGHACIAFTEGALGFTGYTGPVNPCRTRFATIW